MMILMILNFITPVIHADDESHQVSCIEKDPPVLWIHHVTHLKLTNDDDDDVVSTRRLDSHLEQQNRSVQQSSRNLPLHTLALLSP